MHEYEHCLPTAADMWGFFTLKLVDKLANPNFFHRLQICRYV